MSGGRGGVPAIVATAVPMFMVALDNLVVVNALVPIREDYGVAQPELQWVVNGYVLAFAGLLLAATALGDRYGRRRVFLGGVALFTAASAACALAGAVEVLVAARVLQGAGAAAILPLSLTLAVAAVPERLRPLAVGLWGGINGLGIALGPLVGGLVMAGLDWQWIFWINVPVGLAALPLVRRTVREGHGRPDPVDVRGTVLVTAAVTLGVWTIVRAGDRAVPPAEPLVTLVAAVALLVAFVRWERRAPAPLVPPGLVRNRAFALSNAVALLMYFGVFGSIFFLAQYLQWPMGYDPLEAGIRTLPWTLAPMVVVPVTSLLVERIGGGVLQAAGCALQGGALLWIALIAEPGTSYRGMVPALVVAGAGMGIMFAANPATVIAAVPEDQHGKASGVNNTVREFGGGLGIAVLTAVFMVWQAAHPGTPAAEEFTGALRAAVLTGAVVVLGGAVLALFIIRPAGSGKQRPAISESPVPVDSATP
ncbi:drug resistance transporter, EmrB/QacA subfamily [Thermomonospora echinospora]|uniref:Drug resistance transporter, EmrB/QacA subfamily n=1 Tax=Thermomonospora echinospora TaxID=1992 RepID=A0A1H5VFU1_9ACTN|nr:MFS transporter [Thermomonospora echinospora]SEF86133.1 drug resistance transporter, EmrB/QacA subfamily [Thermomonospora echinospora]